MQINFKQQHGVLVMCLLCLLSGCSGENNTEDNVSSVAFSPDSRSLAIGYENLNVKTVGPKTGSQIREFKGQFPKDPDRIATIAFSPDGKLLAAGIAGLSGDAISIWDASTGKLNHFIPHAAQSLAFFPDSKTLAGGGAEWRNNTWSIATLFWDASTGKLKQTLRRPAEGGIRSLALSSDGRTLVTANDIDGSRTQTLSMDSIMRGWDVKSGKMLWSAKEPTTVNQLVAYSPRADIVASAGMDFVQLRVGRTGKIIRKVQSGHFPTALSFSPDGSTLAIGTSTNSVTLWDVATGTWAKSLDDHIGPVTCVAYSPDGSFLASGSEDHTVNVWDTRTWKIVSSVGEKYKYIDHSFS